MASEEKRRPWIEHIWPRLEIPSLTEEAEAVEQGKKLDERIKNLESLSEDEAALFIAAAREIQEYEISRRANAESRATTIITTVATLFTFMTWALANASKDVICTGSLGCGIWAVIFAAAVVYFIAAAITSMRVLKVSTWEVIGVEDLLRYRETKENVSKALTCRTLLTARRNRKTINMKISHIKIAQRQFLCGLVVLGALLIWDPFARLGITSYLKNALFGTQAISSKTVTGSQ